MYFFTIDVDEDLARKNLEELGITTRLRWYEDFSIDVYGADSSMDDDENDTDQIMDFDIKNKTENGLEVGMGKRTGLDFDMDVGADVKSDTARGNKFNKYPTSTEQYSPAFIRSRFDFRYLSQKGIQGEDAEVVENILYDVLNTTKKTIRVHREEKPAEVVKSRLLKLTPMDIEYAFNKVKDVKKKISSHKAYFLTVLYDAKGQSSLDYRNRVNHDMYWDDD